MGPHRSDIILHKVVEESRGQLYPWCSESYGILSRDRKSVGGKKNGILIRGCRQVQFICHRWCEQAAACKYGSEQVQEGS